jgi:long-chain acyl-CoA synthetase
VPEKDFNVTDPIFEWARRTPYAVAVIEGDKVVHYRTLCTAVLRAMAAFRGAGWEPGQVIAVSMQENFALQLAVSIALARAGLTQVWLPLSDPAEFRAARSRRFRVAAVITDQTQGPLDTIARFAPDAGWLSASSAATAPEDLRVRGAGRAMILIQSSGTTGTPKDIVVTQDEELLYANRNNPSSGCLPGERCMLLTGLGFWTGLTRALRCLFNGGAVVAPPQRWRAAELLRLIVLHKVTYLWCAPVHIQFLLEETRGHDPALPQLRVFRCSSGALPVSVVREAQRRISPNLSIQYGSNETGGIAAAPPELVERHPDCVGFPLPGLELQVVDDEDRPVAAGNLGHVRVRGAGIGTRRMLGAAPGEAPGYKGEWFYPGDVGVRDAEGVVYLKGRSDEVMNFDGIMVGPAEIESVLKRHPAVVDAAAFPLPSPRRQDVPAAAVVLRHPVAMKELVLYCSKHLASRAPKRIFAIESIPRSAIGKILRRQLTELALATVNAGGTPAGDAG